MTITPEHGERAKQDFLRQQKANRDTIDFTQVVRAAMTEPDPVTDRMVDAFGRRVYGVVPWENRVKRDFATQVREGLQSALLAQRIGTPEPRPTISHRVVAEVVQPGIKDWSFAADDSSEE